MKNVIVLFFSFFLFLAHMAAQNSIIGTWKVVDNSTNDIRYHVQIFNFEGRVYGKVIKMVKLPGDMKCALCPSDLRDQPIQGMLLVEKLQLMNGFYKNGKMLDPLSGRWYSCQMWLKEEDPDVLVVRGFLGFIYSTQYWYRIE
jgi:uncharacterized protein (DUF2147 family)